jgi:hypothetical protein
LFVGERVMQYMRKALSESRVRENRPPGYARHNTSIVTKPRPPMGAEAGYSDQQRK